mgnify:CR=1 FL=1
MSQNASVRSVARPTNETPSEDRNYSVRKNAGELGTVNISIWITGKRSSRSSALFVVVCSLPPKAEKESIVPMPVRIGRGQKKGFIRT